MNPATRALGVLKGYASLPRAALVLCLGSFINNLGNFVGPFLTLILTDRAGLTPSQTGFFVTLSSLVALAGILSGGKLADSVGRKVVLVVFTGAAIAAYVACAFVVDRTLLLVGLLMVFTLCNSVAQPVHNTILMDVTPPEHRRKAFSLSYVALNAGFAVGPLLASFLYARHLQLLFLLDGATTLVSLLLAVAFIPESHPFRRDARGRPAAPDEVDEDGAGPSDPSAEKDEAAVRGGVLAVLRKRPQLLFFIVTNVVFFLVFSQFTFGLSLQAKATFGDFGPTVFGLMMTVNGLVVVLFSIPATHLFRRLDPLATIAAGSLFYAAGFGAMALIRTVPLFLLATFVWTLGEVLVSPSTSVYLASHTPITHRGRFNAIFPVIRRLGFAAGPMLAGLYADWRGGISAVWLPTAVLALVAGAMTVWLLGWQRRSEAKAACHPTETVV
jgi:MFS family permease